MGRIRNGLIGMGVIGALAFGTPAHAADSYPGLQMGGHRMGQGGGPRGMMGGTQEVMELLDQFVKRLKRPPGSSSEDRELLKKEIRERREELPSLLRSPNPDRQLIERKIQELNRLESELE